MNDVSVSLRISLLLLALTIAIYSSVQFDGISSENQRLLLVMLSAAALSAFVVEFFQDANGPTTLKALVSMGTLAATATAYFSEFPGDGVGLHEWFLMSLVILAGFGLGLIVAMYQSWFGRLFPGKNASKP